jgi:hypothetical protein
MPHNKSLQRTFDPPPIFAVAKTGVASNAAELRRYSEWQRADVPCKLKAIDNCFS